MEHAAGRCALVSAELHQEDLSVSAAAAPRPWFMYAHVQLKPKEGFLVERTLHVAGATHSKEMRFEPYLARGSSRATDLFSGFSTDCNLLLKQHETLLQNKRNCIMRNEMK